jgi:hypothetical protein
MDLSETTLASDSPPALVRLDPIEAWAPRAYAFEAIPGYSQFVRQAVLGLFEDGRVVYIETSTVGARLFRRKKWVGTIHDLGNPDPAPAGFRLAKALRLHQVKESSFQVRIDGDRRIVCFTGVAMDKEPSRSFVVARNVLANVPNVGTIVGWTEAAAARIQNPHGGRDAAAAAAVWRSVLEGRTKPASLPRLQSY